MPKSHTYGLSVRQKNVYNTDKYYKVNVRFIIGKGKIQEMCSLSHRIPFGPCMASPIRSFGRRCHPTDPWLQVPCFQNCTPTQTSLVMPRTRLK